MAIETLADDPALRHRSEIPYLELLAHHTIIVVDPRLVEDQEVDSVDPGEITRPQNEIFANPMLLKKASRQPKEVQNINSDSSKNQSQMMIHFVVRNNSLP